MRNRKAINLIARNGKAMWEAMYGIDAAAKAVILAEYGKQVWSDVKQYAKAHPQIVEFINQDPHLACSISPNSNKERWLVGDGKGAAYIDTGFVPTNNTSIAIKLQFTRLDANSQQSCLFGSRSTYNSNCISWGWGNSYWNVTGDSCFTSWGKNPTYKMIQRPLDLLPHELLLDKGAYYIDGVLKHTYTSAAFTCPYNLYLFNLRQDAGLLPNGLNSDGMITNVVVKEGDAIIREMYPCLYNGIAGMVDAISGTFHPNANTQGTFTIQITDKE